jgi:hypothetical protein
LHSEELRFQKSSPNIIQVIKSKRMRWALLVERMGGRKMYAGFWWGKLNERERLEDVRVDEK